MVILDAVPETPSNVKVEDGELKKGCPDEVTGNVVLMRLLVLVFSRDKVVVPELARVGGRSKPEEIAYGATAEERLPQFPEAGDP